MPSKDSASRKDTAKEDHQNTAVNPWESILPNVTHAIGNTPLVELSRLTKHHQVQGRILAKLEYLQPGFSKKDRIALQILQQAKASGELQDGQTIVELTSGNTGTGLAICASTAFAERHPLICVMSQGNSLERARMMEALGAQVVLVPQAPESTPGQVSGKDLELVEQRTQELVREHKAFRVDQFQRDANAMAHYTGTAPEIWKQSQGSITAFCDFVGTGGSFAGCARYFNEKKIACYVVEPKGAAVLAGQLLTCPNHKIQGGGYSMKDLPLFESTRVDGYLQVTDEEAIQVARDLARLEGIFGGFSGGANAAAALQLLKTTQVGGTIAILICDSGLKYLSTDLWPEFKSAASTDTNA